RGRARGRHWRAAILGLGVVIALLALSASPASAHATVVSSTPQEGKTLDKAPGEVVIKFSEPVSVVAADTGVTAPDGSKAHASTAVSEGDQIRYDLRGDLPDGTYVVSYRVISADGHPVPGGYTFSVGKSSKVPEAAEPGSGSDPLVTGLVYGNRYLGYAGLVLVLGPALLLLAGSPGSRRGAIRLTVTGLSLIAGTAVIGLYLQAPYTAGTGLFGVSGPDIGSVLASRFGGASMARLLLVLIALPLLKHALAAVRVRAKPDDEVTTASSAAGSTPGVGRGMEWLLAAVAAALAATWPVSGHATTSAAPALTVLSDTVHIAAATVWLGGLVTLGFFLVKRGRAAEAESFLPTWSRWATWIVASLAIAGLAQALIHIGTVDGLLSTTYGWLVIAKAGLFAGLLVTAALARRLVRATGKREVVTPVRRLILTELAIGVVVLGLSSVLVQAVPAQGAVAPTAQEQPQTFSKTVKTDLFTLQVELEPVTVGRNEAHLYLFEPDGVTEMEAEEWTASFGRPSEGISLVRFDLALLSPNHASGEVELPQKGKWTFEFKIRTSKLDRETVTTVVSVKL
ncbi:MAG: copper resistance CopC/CopD family protein, partial [Stackebrandtia sp.]